MMNQDLDLHLDRCDNKEDREEGIYSLRNGEDGVAGIADKYYGKRVDEIRALVSRELNMSVQDIRKEWLDRARLIAGKTGDGH